MRELDVSEVGECEFQWASKYGQSYRIKGGFGVSISSPHHVGS